MSEHAKLPRRVHVGEVPDDEPGARLRCLALTTTVAEWVGVDLGTGAFVRVPGDAPTRGEDQMPVVVDLALAGPNDAPDPARPELVRPASEPSLVGSTRPRALRRLLGRLATPERDGAAILDARGPSIAYVDLDGTAPSISLLAVTAKHVEVATDQDGSPTCVITWGGTTQRVRVADADVARAAMTSAPRPLGGTQLQAALGRRVEFALVGLGQVSDGHAPKVLLALL